jgi:NAD+ synthase (glutamine-hydrolysing)
MCCVTGFRPSKIAFLAWHAWRDPERGEWPPGFPVDERFGYTLSEIRHWLEVFAQRFFEFSQFKRSALPNGPKVSAGGSVVAAGRLASTLGHVRANLAG